MRKILLPAIGLVLAVPASLLAFQDNYLPIGMQAFADAPALLQGCTDVPEAVALAEDLRDREIRIEQYMQTLDQRKFEITKAEVQLKKKLFELKSIKDEIRSGRSSRKNNIESDIDRLVAVYDQMKPSDAADVLTNLPADFAAEILMRVQPETGARIIASVEPRQAALLTAQMGARNVGKSKE